MIQVVWFFGPWGWLCGLVFKFGVGGVLSGVWWWSVAGIREFFISVVNTKNVSSLIGLSSRDVCGVFRGKSVVSFPWRLIRFTALIMACFSILEVPSPKARGEY